MPLSTIATRARREGPPLVLLVEDHRDTRQMYAAYLSGTYEIAEAPDAERALALIKTRPPGLVITDLSLPGIDGFELVDRLRKNPETRRIPIICLSGFGGHTLEQRAREVGCDLVLQKPCLPDALAEAAARVIQGHKGANEA